MRLLTVLLIGLLSLVMIACEETETDDQDIAEGVEGLFINEFLAKNEIDSVNVDENGGYDDWVELYNSTDAAIDIGGMYITDSADDLMQWQIPATDASLTTVPAGGYLIIWCDKQPDEGALHMNIKLSTDGEAIVLTEADGETIVDSVKFGAQVTNVSMGRSVDGGDTWVTFTTPSPGAANVEPVGALVINEFLASNDTSATDENGDHDDWVELYNGTDAAIDIGGMYITDDPADLTQHQIADSSASMTTIPAGGYLILWCDKESEQGVLHMEIKLSGDGESVVLVDTDGVTVIDEFTFGPQQADISLGRFVDGGGIWIPFTTPTPGATNG